ncbi:unnamed protein product [Caenorhabditis nigoni]
MHAPFRSEPCFENGYIDMIEITIQALVDANQHSNSWTTCHEEKKSGEEVVLGTVDVGTDCLWMSGSTSLHLDSSFFFGS